MNDSMTLEKKSRFPLIVAAVLGSVALVVALAIFVQYRVHRTGLAL